MGMTRLNALLHRLGDDVNSFEQRLPDAIDHGAGMSGAQYHWPHGMAIPPLISMIWPVM